MDIGNEQVRACDSCGASIYQEHLDRGMAGFVAGRLLCAVCLGEQGQAPTGGGGDLEPIALVDESEVPAGQTPAPQAESAGSQAGTIRGFSVAKGDVQYRRPLLKGPNATRCKTFHCKLAEGAIAYMNEQLNEWCDRNPDIEIKFCTSTVGVFEGKHPEPHLFLTVFY